MRDIPHAVRTGGCDYTEAMRLPAPTLLRAMFVLSLSLAAALPAQAQWKWRDANGRITASDLPPPREIADKDILQRPDPVARRAAPVAPTAAASAAPVARPALDKDLEAKRRAADEQKQAQAQADEQRLAAQRVENCQRARNHVAELKSGVRIARTNDKGEREILDDKGRAEEMRRANDVIAADCR